MYTPNMQRLTSDPVDANRQYAICGDGIFDLSDQKKMFQCESIWHNNDTPLLPKPYSCPNGAALYTLLPSNRYNNSENNTGTGGYAFTLAPCSGGFWPSRGTKGGGKICCAMDWRSFRYSSGAGGS